MAPICLDVVINATNNSTVTLESAAQLSGSSIDIEATTDVDPPATVNGPTPVMILADDLADSYLDPTNIDNGPTNGNSDNATTLAGHPVGTLVGLAVTIANTTEVVIASGAQVDAGSGEVGSSGDSLVINAADQTNVITEFQPASTVYLPLINGVVIFSAIDSTISLDRTTDVLIGDTNSAAANPTLAAGLDTHDTASTPSTSANNTLQATGDAAVTASSGGSIMNEETSDPAQGSAVGSTETTAGSSSSNPGDTTIVELRGINVNVGGLAASATSATDYLSESHYVTNTVFGATDGLIDHSNVTAGAGGLSLESTDNSTLTAIADSFDINSEHLTGGADKFTLTVSATDALNSLDKDVSAQLVNSVSHFGRYDHHRSGRQRDHRCDGGYRDGHHHDNAAGLGLFRVRRDFCGERHPGSGHRLDPECDFDDDGGRHGGRADRRRCQRRRRQYFADRCQRAGRIDRDGRLARGGPRGCGRDQYHRLGRHGAARGRRCAQHACGDFQRSHRHDGRRDRNCRQMSRPALSVRRWRWRERWR